MLITSLFFMSEKAPVLLKVLNKCPKSPVKDEFITLKNKLNIT